MKELIDLEERFQPFLQNNDYTFIGPANVTLMENFIRSANMSAPVIANSRSVHHALSHKPSVLGALGILPVDAELRIYVVVNEADDFLFHATIEEYCQRFNIDFG